jgi:glycosyltransferase involved in cell wall biosynthesis
MSTGRRGLYIVRLDLAEPHAAGVARKIRSQAAALAAALGPVDLLYPGGTRVMCNDRAIRSLGTASDSPARARFWRRVLHVLVFYLTVARIAEVPDFVYIRYQRTSPAFLWMLSRLRARNPGMAIIVEFPSFPYHSENTGLRDRVLGLSDRLLRPLLKRHVDRIVTFSRRPEILGIPTVCSDNGTDVAGVRVLAPPAEDREIRLLGLANLSFWHGYDRVIAGLAAWRDQAPGRRPARRVVFDIVGAGRERARLEDDVRRFGLEDLVRFHGPQQGPALDAIMAGCHIGISSIGMHRLVVDTSNLKSREVCARGLPFVIAYPDHDFGPEFRFALQAPATDDPIDIAALLAFHDRLRAECPDYPAQMRAYAETRLTWEAKLAPVAVAVRAILAGRG